MDLEELKARGTQLRLEHRRELQNLKSEFEPLFETLHAKHEHPDTSIYHQVMEPAPKFSSFEGFVGEMDDDGFQDFSLGGDEEEEEDEEPEFTPFVRKIQSQLCAALHQQEINKRQIKMAQKGNKRLIISLATEIEAQKALTKRREEDFQTELKEVASANQVMMKMLEGDALDQEERITEMRLQLGMNPTPNSQRIRFGQRLSGGLRGLGRRVRQTPKNIRGSKVWKDLVAAPESMEVGEDEQDEISASERRSGILGRLRRPSRAGEEKDPSSAFAHQEKKGRFHSSRVEKLSLEDIENDGHLGLVGRIRRSRQMRQSRVHDSELGQYLENRNSDSIGSPEQQPKEGRRPLQGVRRRASNLRKRLVKRESSGKSVDSMASTLPPTPPTNDKALFPMDDDMFSQEIFALSI